MRTDLSGVDAVEPGADGADLEVGLAPVADYMNRLIQDLQAMSLVSAVPGSSEETPPLIKTLSAAQADLPGVAELGDPETPETKASSIGAVDNISLDFAQRLRSQTEEPPTNLADFKRGLTAAVSAAQSSWQARLDLDLATATKVWNDRIEGSMERGGHRVADLVIRSSEDMARQLKEVIIARLGDIAQRFAAATGETEKHLTAVLTSLGKEIDRGEAVLAELSSAATGVDEQASNLATLTASTQQELQRASAMMDWHSQELLRRARQSMANSSETLQTMIETAAKETVGRLGGKFELELSSHLERARETLRRLEDEQHAAENLLRTCQQQVQELSEQAAKAALARLPLRKFEDGPDSGIGQTPRLAATALPEIDFGINRSIHNAQGNVQESKCEPKQESIPEQERRKDRRLKISRQLLVRPADPKIGEAVETTLNASRNGLYFTTPGDRYYVGMNLSLVLGYAPNDPCNSPSFGEVIRIERRGGGSWGIGVHILIH